MINKQRLVALTRQLIRINSENPPGNEWAISNFIEKEMRSLGLNVRTHSFAPRRPNIVATLKARRNSNTKLKPALLISPHVDTVPAGTGWTHDPFNAKVVNGPVYRPRGLG